MPITVDFVQYHKSIADELKATQDRVRNLIADHHWLTDGEYKEVILRTLLRSRLPESFHVGRGFVCYQDSPSKQLDVLITEKSKPTLFREGDLVIVTPDCVEAIIEVKTRLDSPKDLLEALDTLAEQTHRIRDSESGGRCWSGLFVLNGPEHQTDDAYREEARGVLEAISQACQSRHESAIDCVAFGANIFVRYWSDGIPRTNTQEPGWSCYVFNNPAHAGLAPAFFLGNLVWELSSPNNHHMAYAWFPVGKERYRVAYIGLRSKEVVSDSVLDETPG